MNHIESPVYSFLSDAADLILANFLCALCCVPVLTIGASLAALDKVSLDIVLGNGGGILKKFFAAFRENFRYGTLLFWLWLIVAAGLFWRLLILWPLFGLGAVSWLSNTLMKPVLEAIESEAALDGV